MPSAHLDPRDGEVETNDPDQVSGAGVELLFAIPGKAEAVHAGSPIFATFPTPPISAATSAIAASAIAAS